MPPDDEAPLSGAADAIKPWTLRAVPTQIRDAAIAAARAENMTVSHWVERLIRDRLEGGPLTHGSSNGQSDPVPLLEAVYRIAEASGTKVPQSVANHVYALARLRLREARGLSPRRLSGPDAPAGATMPEHDSAEN